MTAGWTSEADGGMVDADLRHASSALPLQSQKAVSAYFTSKQILPFNFAQQHGKIFKRDILLKSHRPYYTGNRKPSVNAVPNFDLRLDSECLYVWGEGSLHKTDCLYGLHRAYGTKTP